MKSCPIISVPNPILTTPAKPVKTIDNKIKDIIEKLIATLTVSKHPKGVGLAAPQLGMPYRIFITRPQETALIRVFINPEILEKSNKLGEIERPSDGKVSLKKDNKLEGCLSIPNVWGHLKRPIFVKLRYLDLNGKLNDEQFNGFMATIVQHETDHLNGILFTQRVLEQKEKLFEIEEDEKGKEKLVELRI